MTNIRSSYKYKQCDDICRAIALLRAGERCELCGEPTKERHHIFFGRVWAAYWQLRLNHNFHFILCHREHHEEPYAPHRDNYQFMALLENKLIAVDKPRLIVIQQQRKVIRAGQMPDVPLDLDIVRKALQREYEKFEKTSWMDMESQQLDPRIA